MPTCYGCDGPIDDEYGNAMWVTLDGGYGMFVESARFLADMALGSQKFMFTDREMTWEEHPMRVLICHECAHAACEAVPWLDRLITPYGSHAHNRDDYERLKAEGHQGWDLEPTPTCQVDGPDYYRAECMEDELDALERGFQVLAPERLENDYSRDTGIEQVAARAKRAIGKACERLLREPGSDRYREDLTVIKRARKALGQEG